MMYQLKTVVFAEAVKYSATDFVTQELVVLMLNAQAVNLVKIILVLVLKVKYFATTLV